MESSFGRAVLFGSLFLDLSLVSYTPQLRSLVPETPHFRAFGTRVLKWGVYGPVGNMLHLKSWHQDT